MRWPQRRPTPGSPSATAVAVEELETSGRRVCAVRLAGGERLPADAVVVTTDQPHTLVPGLRGPRRPVYSPSCVALHLGVRHELREQAHHTISFGDPWRGVFDELTRDGRIMSDPSLLVSMPSRTDRSLAPDGGQVLSVVAPTPNLDRRSGGNPDLDWARDRPAVPRRAAGHPGGPGLDGPDRCDRGRGDGHAAGLGRRGHGRRHPVRAGAHVRADRPVPAPDPPPQRARRTSSWPGRPCSRVSGCRWC